MNKLLKVVLFGLALTVSMTACNKTEEAATTAAPEVVAPAAVEVPSETVSATEAAAAQEVAVDAVQAAKDAAAAEAK